MWFQPEKLLAEIGGTLGLFIGLSVCTALEVAELLLDSFIVLFKRFGRCGQGATKSGRKRNVIQVLPMNNGNV